MSFHIGDRVYEEKRGAGTVVCIDDCPPNIGVRFDEAVGGHSLNGCCEEGHGYWVFDDLLTHLDGRTEETSTIFQKGDRVVYLGGNLPKGSLGTALFYGNVIVPVRFDDPVPNGTDCDGRCQYGYGYYCSVNNLRLARPIDSTDFLTLLRGDQDA